MLRGFKNSLGQGTLEYVIILAAVVAAMIVVSGYIRGKIGGTSNTDTSGGYQHLTKQSVDEIEAVSFDPKPKP
ncbi:MAG: hypothetical protein AAB089_04480 [Nitrospirota bacterium]